MKFSLPKNEIRRRAFLKRAVGVVLSLILLVSLAVFKSCSSYYQLLSPVSLPARAEGELRIHFTDVGQGDCTIVEFPGGDVLVVDAGDGGGKNDVKLVRYLKGLAPRSISMILTHADVDHYGGFIRLLKEFDAKAFYLPEIGETCADYEELLSAIGKNGCDLDRLSRYRTISDESGAYLVCLSPYSAGETDGNDVSAVLFLSYCGTRAILCGDISSAREKLLLRENALYDGIFSVGEYTVDLSGTDILKVAHHGSAYSSCAEWLNLLGARTAILSCGRGNSYYHPSGETLQRLADAGAQIYRTDELGDIVVGIGQAGYEVRTRLTEDT